MNHIARLGMLSLALSLGACAVLDGEKIDYKSAGKGSSLAVPPDLTQLSRDSRYVLPGGAVTASTYQAGQPMAVTPVAGRTLGDVRIERAGTQRWLVVNRAPEKLWEPVRDFWQENGFLLTLDQSNLGIMETDWAENRAKLPQDFIRNTLGKLLDSVYSTGERDKFRTRLESTASGATEIYVSHRGMIEVYPDNQTRDRTVWQPRAVDAELETEFLRRLMVKLGGSTEEARTIAVVDAARPTSRIATVNNMPVVQIDDGFDRAWRRVGLSLDRTGFTVEDRDRSQGTYFVRYVEPTPDKKEPGLIAKFFKSASSTPPLKYRITVRSQGESTTVSVLNASGAPESSANAQRIVKVIADDLR